MTWSDERTSNPICLHQLQEQWRQRVQKLEDTLAQSDDQLTELQPPVKGELSRRVAALTLEGPEKAKAFTDAIKLTRIERFSGQKDRTGAFCNELSRLRIAYDQMSTYQGFLYATSHLIGNARV